MDIASKLPATIEIHSDVYDLVINREDSDWCISYAKFSDKEGETYDVYLAVTRGDLKECIEATLEVLGGSTRQATGSTK